MVNSKHIVILDDDVYLSEMIYQLLTIEGYQVTMLQDGKDLVDNLERYNPDLILLDIKMPVMDGQAVLKAIRAKSPVPVIMLTGVGDVDSPAAYIEMGADDYMNKPFYPHELTARISAKLRRSSQEKQH